MTIFIVYKLFAVEHKEDKEEKDGLEGKVEALTFQYYKCEQLRSRQKTPL